MEEELEEGIQFASAAESVKEEQEAVEQPKEEVKEEAGEPAHEEVQTEAEPPKEEPKDDPYGKPGHTPSGVQERINSLTKDKHELKRENESLRGEIERLKKFVGIDREPTKEDFLKGGKTEAEYQEYVIDKRAREVAERMFAEREEATRRNAMADRFNKSVESARKVFADYDAVVYGDNPVKGSQKVLDALCDMEGDVGADVTYFLNKDANLRKQYESMASDDSRVDFVKGLGKQLLKMKTDAIEKGKATAQPNVNQQPVQSPAPQQATQTIREPGVMPSGNSQVRKKLNPAECSMEEWMEGGF